MEKLTYTIGYLQERDSFNAFFETIGSQIPLFEIEKDKNGIMTIGFGILDEEIDIDAEEFLALLQQAMKEL